MIKIKCGERKMKWKIDEQHAGLLINDYLRTVHYFSRRIIKAIKFDGGKIEVNGKEQTVRYRLMKNDVITITFPPEKKGSYMNPENKGLSIVYEDEDIIIINKPPGLVTMPSRLHPSGTLANRVLGYYQRKSIPYTVHVVTRLDRDTSGLILIAKHRYSHSLLASDQNKGKLIRRYKAIVEGDVEQREGIIDAPIRRKPGSIIERQVSETGQRAITHYKVEKEGAGHSLLAVELLTGRTHQIRVHFSSIHHPLAGDDLYGGSKKVIDRQALHCYEISFQHPLTKEPILIQLDMPQDMSSIIK